MVGDPLALEVFVVGDVTRADCRVQLNDCNIGTFWDAWNQGQDGIDAPPEGCLGGEHQAGEDELGRDWGFPVGEEEQAYVPVVHGCREQGETSGLVDGFRAEGDLDECAAISHKRVGRAARGPVCL